MTFIKQLNAWGGRIESIGNGEIGVYKDVMNTLELVQEIAAIKDSQGNKDAFLVVNLNTLIERFDMWKEELPGVEPFYAVKSNPDPIILRILAALGANFDCASNGEIDLVLGIGVSPSRIIFANPAKAASYIEYARDVGIRMMTFDSIEEMKKIKGIYPRAQLLLRISTEDKSSMSPLSGKFGAHPRILAPQLLNEARAIGLDIAGISFHVGSGCRDPNSFANALDEVRILYDLGKELGFSMRFVDIGGGFPGGKLNANFEECASVIRNSLEIHFPNKEIKAIAEPGRFFSAGAITLCASIIHSTELHGGSDSQQPSMKYYINDGVYGSFGCRLQPNPYLHSSATPLNLQDGPLLECSIWGPTCDTADKIEDNKWMTRQFVGDWLYYTDMGAYSMCTASSFNGFPPTTKIYAIGEKNWSRISNRLAEGPAISVLAES